MIIIKEGLITVDFNSHTLEGVTLRIFLKFLLRANFNAHTLEGVTSNLNG